MSKRGAPLNNKNALKHGFYSRAFLNGELKDLEEIKDTGLDSEIALLRVATRKVFEIFSQISKNDDLDFDSIVSALGALGLAAIRTSTLLRSQAIISGNSSTVDAALTEALSQIYDEWKLE